MKKILFFAAAAVAMLASCSQNDDLTQPKVTENQQTPVEFGTYLGKTAQTRAGWAGDITDTELKSSSNANGFGVFAFYTGADTYNTKNGAYNSTNKIAPNFMYNEHIYWDGTNNVWKYNNTKYWPNEIQNGAVDVPGATTANTNGGKVSFFAYAPYVDESTSLGSTGITAITANNSADDPKVTYTFATTGKNVDLLWGTYGSTTASVVGGTLNQGVVSTAATISQRPVANRATWAEDILSTTAGTPTAYKMNGDLVKQENDGTVGFLFKHALSKVGGTSTTNPTNASGLQIVLDADAIAANNAAGNTVVTVEDIKITTKPMAYLDNDGTEQTGKYITGGQLNLATGKWTVNVSDDAANAIVHELDRTGENKSGSLNADIAEPASVTSMSGTPMQVNGTVPGVTGTPANVYGTATSPMLFIPGCKPKFEIEITYYVRSYDSKLDADAASGGEGTWTKVKQTIKKEVEFAKYTELNKRYTLLIHLGITSVKFTASVSAWDDDSAGIDTDGNGTGDSNVVALPLNVN